MSRKLATSGHDGRGDAAAHAIRARNHSRFLSRGPAWVQTVQWRRGAFGALVFLIVTSGCTRSHENQRELPTPSRAETDSRSPAVKREYAARVEAVARNPTSAPARGALACFLHANDDLDEAAAQYAQLRASDPKDARWSYYLARIRQDEGRLADARVLLGEAAVRAPEYALIELRRADLLLKSGEASAAEAAYLSYLSRVPGDAYAHLGLARLAVQNQDWPRAESWLTKALAQEPDFSAARTLLVSVLEEQAKTAQAAALRETSRAQRHREPDDPWLDALARDCFDVERLSVLADIALESGRAGRALELLERSLSIEPARARTYFELAQAKLKTDDRTAAIGHLKKAVSLEPGLAEAHYALVGELQTLGQLAAGLLALDSATRHNPKNSGLHRQRGTLLQAAGRTAEAEASLERAVMLDSTDVKNVEALGNFLWASDRKEQSILHFERARALSRLAVKPRAMLGGYYLESGRLPEAERCIAEAYEIEPRLDGLDELRALVHVRRGNALFRAGDQPRAEAEFRTALAIKPEHEEALTNLVAVWLRAHRGPEARALLTTFISEHPKLVFGYSLAARVFAQTGDLTAAGELVNRGLVLARDQADTQQEQVLRALQARLPVPAK